MKRFVIAISLMMVILAIANLLPGRAQDAGAPQQQAPNNGVPPPMNQATVNPVKVALLKWYAADLTTSFKVGEQPVGLAFDGANIWVSNNGDNTVSKLRANDGQVLGTGQAHRSAAHAEVPFFSAFDGEAIWVTNTQGASVTKLRARDGKVLGTFADNGGPIDIICDGTYMWVTNFDGTVTRFKLDGKPAGTFKVTRGGLLTLAFDGANIWVPDNGGNVSKLRASDGKILAVYNIGTDGSGIAFDGVNLWLTAGPYIAEVRPSDGTVLLAKRLNQTLEGLAFDGANVWAAGWGADRVFKL